MGDRGNRVADQVTWSDPRMISNSKLRNLTPARKDRPSKLKVFDFRPVPDSQDPPSFKTVAHNLWIQLGYHNSPESFDTIPNFPTVPTVPTVSRFGRTHRPLLPYEAEHMQAREKLMENRDKCTRMLMATENFYFGGWKESDMEPIYGGVHSWGVEGSALALAQFALSFLNKLGEEEIMLKQVIRVNGQCVGCTLHWITMEASDDKFYEAVVIVSCNREEKELKYIRPAKYYPQIPAHLHHLMSPNA